MPILYSIIIIAALYFLVRYWDKKRKKDKELERKKEVDRLLDMEEEIPEDYYLKY